MAQLIIIILAQSCTAYLFYLIGCYKTFTKVHKELKQAKKGFKTHTYSFTENYKDFTNIVTFINNNQHLLEERTKKVKMIQLTEDNDSSFSLKN